MNIETCLEKYSDKFYSLMYGVNDRMSPEESMEKAKAFLLQYAMSDQEYREICLPVMQKIFRCSPDKCFNIQAMTISEMFRNDFVYFSYQSAPLFWKESYELVLSICKNCGDHNIFIVEEERCEECPTSVFQIKIPVGIPWNDISDGGFITDVLFNMFRNNYYVFGDSGSWGKWCDYDNDYIDYEVFGYRHSNTAVLAYKDYFSISKNDFKEYINLPGNLRVAFWNTIKREKKSKMKYFSFKAKQEETIGESKSRSVRILPRFFERAVINTICHIIPKVNPDDIYNRVKTWYVEYDKRE